MPVLNLLRGKETDGSKKSIQFLFSDDPGSVPNFYGRGHERDLGGGRKGG